MVVSALNRENNRMSTGPDNPGRKPGDSAWRITPTPVAATAAVSPALSPAVRTSDLVRDLSIASSLRISVLSPKTLKIEMKSAAA